MKTISMRANIPDDVWAVMSEDLKGLRQSVTNAVAREYARAQARTMAAALRSKTFVTITVTDTPDKPQL